MSCLYKNQGTYYLSVNVDGQRKVRSLKTKDKDIAINIKSKIELEMQKELRGWNNKWKTSLSREASSDYFIKSSLVNGKVGELYVDADLLKRGFSPSESKLDDSGVDRIVEIKKPNNQSKFITLQIKYSSQYNSKNSVW